jgi:hypothetical protein
VFSQSFGHQFDSFVARAALGEDASRHSDGFEDGDPGFSYFDPETRS